MGGSAVPSPVFPLIRGVRDAREYRPAIPVPPFGRPSGLGVLPPAPSLGDMNASAAEVYPMGTAFGMLFGGMKAFGTFDGTKLVDPVLPRTIGAGDFSRSGLNGCLRGLSGAGDAAG